MLLVLLLPILITSGSGQRIVDTEYGQVRGHEVTFYNGIVDTSVDVFYGIPFAKPPLDSLRFMSPVPPDAWPGIYEADTIRDMCAQTSYLIDVFHPDWDRYSEDCLHLNIYTPAGGGGPYPVMFWIYGGAFQNGGTITYPGHFLASHGVVVVTVNYRVNNFGFAFTGNAACPGNAGLWDQNLGLQFVVDNIANFGGDPSHITVFGQSAGGASTSLQMVSPHSKDLFQQAIPQSGTENNVWALNPPGSNPESHTRQLAEDLDCDLPDDFDMMDCLRQKPWRQLVFNSTVTECAPGYPCVGMLPVVDGPGGFLPEMPADLRASGSVMSGPIMTGIAKDDASFFMPLIAPVLSADDCCNRTAFERVIRETLQLYEERLTNVTEEDCYHAIDYEYAPWPYLYDTDVNRDQLVKMGTDWMYGVHWDTQIKAHQAVNTTYGYVWDYRSANQTTPAWMGTIHAAEIDFLWGYPLMELEVNEELREDALFLNDTELSYTELDIQYTLFIQEMWTNFAKYGDPTPYPVPNPTGSTVDWTPFRADAMDVLYVGDEQVGGDDVTILHEYRQKQYALWSKYINWMTSAELGTN